MRPFFVNHHSTSIYENSCDKKRRAQALNCRIHSDMGPFLEVVPKYTIQEQIWEIFYEHNTLLQNFVQNQITGGHREIKF